MALRVAPARLQSANSLRDFRPGARLTNARTVPQRAPPGLRAGVSHTNVQVGFDAQPMSSEEKAAPLPLNRQGVRAEDVHKSARDLFENLVGRRTEGAFFDFKREFYAFSLSESGHESEQEAKRNFLRDVAHLHNSLGEPLRGVGSQQPAAFILFGVSVVSNEPKLVGVQLSTFPDLSKLQELVRSNLRPCPSLDLYFIDKDSWHFALLQIHLASRPVRFRGSTYFGDAEWKKRRPVREGAQNVPYDRVTDDMWRRLEAQFGLEGDDSQVVECIQRRLGDIQASSSPHTFKVLVLGARIAQQWDGENKLFERLGSVSWDVVVAVGGGRKLHECLRRSLAAARRVEELCFADLVACFDRSSGAVIKEKDKLEAMRAGTSCLWLGAAETPEERLKQDPKTAYKVPFAFGKLCNFVFQENLIRPVVLVALAGERIHDDAWEVLGAETVSQLVQVAYGLGFQHYLAAFVFALVNTHLEAFPKARGDSLLHCAVRRPEAALLPIVEVLAAPGQRRSITLAGQTVVPIEELKSKQDPSFELYSAICEVPDFSPDALMGLRMRLCRGYELSVEEQHRAFESNMFVVRERMERLREIVVDGLRSAGREGGKSEVLLVHHRPTTGCTTALQWLALLLRSEYPCIALHAVTDRALEAANYLHERCGRPVLLICDGLDVVEVRQALRNRGFPHFAVCSERTVDPRKASRRHPRVFPWPETLSERDKLKFAAMLQSVQRDDAVKEMRDVRLFFWGLAAFLGEFERIESHLKACLSVMTEAEARLFGFAVTVHRFCSDERRRKLCLPLPAAAAVLGLDPYRDWVANRSSLLSGALVDVLLIDDPSPQRPAGHVRPPTTNDHVLDRMLATCRSRFGGALTAFLFELGSKWISLEALKVDDWWPITDALLLQRRGGKFSPFLNLFVDNSYEHGEALMRLASSRAPEGKKQLHLRAHRARFMAHCGKCKQAIDEVRTFEEAARAEKEASLLNICGDVYRVAAQKLEHSGEAHGMESEIVGALRSAIICYRASYLISERGATSFAQLGEAKARLCYLHLLRRLHFPRDLAGFRRRLNDEEDDLAWGTVDRIKELVEKVEYDIRNGVVSKDRSELLVPGCAKLMHSLLKLFSDEGTVLIGEMNQAIGRKDYHKMALAGAIRGTRQWRELREDELKTIREALKLRLSAEPPVWLFYSDFHDLIMARLYLAKIPDSGSTLDDLVLAERNATEWIDRYHGDTLVTFWTAALRFALFLRYKKPEMLRAAKTLAGTLAAGGDPDDDANLTVHFAERGSLNALVLRDDNRVAPSEFWGIVREDGIDRRVVELEGYDDLSFRLRHEFGARAGERVAVHIALRAFEGFVIERVNAQEAKSDRP
jgi:hypothetical protein